MRLDIIDTAGKFEQIREHWDAVYAADPHTTFFLSWEWMRGWIEITPHDWRVPALRQSTNSPYVAFMPLCIQTVGLQRFRRVRKLLLGGTPWSASMGLLCKSENVGEAVPVFADFIQKKLSWDIFHMRNVSDPRINQLLQQFSKKRFPVEEEEGISCPYIQLPNSWDKYLQECLGPRVRKNMRRYTKKIEDLDGFHVTHVHRDNLERQMDELLKLWQMRWGAKQESFLNAHRMLFRKCFESNSLYLTTLWSREVPVAAEAALLDRKSKVFITFAGAFNNAFAGLSPGTVSMGYAIRYAIEGGFRVFNFGMGSYDYKFLFGAKDHINRNIFLRRNTLGGALKKRIPARIKDPLKRLLLPASGAKG